MIFYSDPSAPKEIADLTKIRPDYLYTMTDLVAKIKDLVGFQSVETVVLQRLLEKGGFGQRPAERPAAFSVTADDGVQVLYLVVPQHAVDELFGVL